MRSVRTDRQRKIPRRPTSAMSARHRGRCVRVSDGDDRYRALYGTAADDDARALTKIDEVMNADNYCRLVPPDVVGVERVRAASLRSTVFRSCVSCSTSARAPYYRSSRLSLPDGGAVAESLESYLVSEEETQQDSFVGGTTVRLSKPRQVDDKDTRSLIVVGRVIVGGAETVGHIAGRWRILTMDDTMTVISQNHKAPYRRNIALGDVTEQFAQTLKVYAPHTLASPRTWSEPPIGPNMFVERPHFRRAYQ